ncbi:1,5-anhydro-D-fructose reductase [soil metagenome]
MTVGWGLVGASDIADSRMIPAISSNPNSRVVAIASSSIDRATELGRRHGIDHVYGSVDDLLADDSIDVVYISSTNEHHLSQSLAAAAAGKHVLCEKPLAMTVSDAEAILAACQRAGVVLGTNHHLRNASSHRKIRELVSAGAIGTPLAARLFHAVSLPGRLQGWRINRPDSGGGVIFDITVHDADTLRFDLDDDPVEVLAMTASQGMAVDGLADSVMGVIRFTSGLMAQFHDAFTIGHTHTGIEIHGSDGSIRATDAMTQSPEAVVVLQRGESLEEIDVGPLEDLYSRSVMRFNEAVLGNGQPAATGTDGIWSLAVAVAAQASGRSGATVPVRVPAV